MKFTSMSFILFSVSMLLLPLDSTAQQTGHVTYTLSRASNPTADQQDAYDRITTVMDAAVKYYNTYTSITKTLSVSYVPSVGTADGSFSGSIRFGENRSYMAVLTALHEIAHTVGVGTTNEYRNLIVDGIFTGTKATAMLRELTGDPNAELHGDQQHFWPYGLNYASEYESDDDYVYHCKIVNAMYQDMFKEELYLSCYLRSVSAGTYMTATDDNRLVLGSQATPAALVKMIELGDENTFRLEFGDRVLDIPDESRNAGVAAGLWTWNGGAHQQTVFEFAPASDGNRTARIKMSHSNLYLEAQGNTIVQNNASTSSSTQQWEIVEEGSTVASVETHGVRESRRIIAYSSSDARLTVSPGVRNRAMVQITNVRGRELLHRFVQGTTVLQTSRLTPGMYIISVLGESCRVRESFVVR
ncbi:MAG: hypothetical protein JW863_16190 [Chitinispirillaceae bacterium]|nr:hypothetical protein [Chitinispirillaceae bacterium]